MSTEKREELIKQHIEEVFDKIKFKFDTKNIVIIVGFNNKAFSKIGGEEKYLTTAQKCIQKVIDDGDNY